MDEVQLDTEVMALSGDVTADVTALQAEIARLQAQGQTQAAMAAAAAPVVVTQVAPVAPALVARFIAPTATPKVEGLSERKVWKFRATDLAAVPLQYLTLNESAVRETMNASKGTAKIAGIEFYQETQTVVGR